MSPLITPARRVIILNIPLFISDDLLQREVEVWKDLHRLSRMVRGQERQRRIRKTLMRLKTQSKTGASVTQKDARKSVNSEEEAEGE